MWTACMWSFLHGLWSERWTSGLLGLRFPFSFWFFTLFSLCQIFQPNSDILFLVFWKLLKCIGFVWCVGPRMSEHTPPVCKCLQKSEEGIRFLGTGTPDGCQPPWERWELNPGFQRKQQELTDPVSSFQPRFSQFMLLTVSVAVHRSIQERTLSNSTQHGVHKQVQSVAMAEMKMYLENKFFWIVTALWYPSVCLVLVYKETEM